MITKILFGKINVTQTGIRSVAVSLN